MGKVAVVTGATSGIGKAVVELLLKEKINVVALGRDYEKIEALQIEFASLTKDVSLDFVIGDLSDNRQTNLAANNLIDFIHRKYHDQLDILMNIAGRVTSGYHENEDMNEITFATNHLSVFLLTNRLYPLLNKSEDPRVLVVSSLSHYRAIYSLNNLQSKKGYNILRAYQRSKLYNVLFVKEFARRSPHVKIYAIDPGLVKTNIGNKNTSKLARFVWEIRSRTGTSPHLPAKFMIDVAVKDEYASESGSYIKAGQIVRSAKITYNKNHQKSLWDYSERLTQVTYEF